MIDIVYVVGKGAKKINDLPLRWSLRSVERFAKNVGRIIVSGYPPDWLSDEVIKVYFEQTHKKHVNMLLSIAEAVKQVGLTEKFLYSSDDHYFSKPANLEEWPRYCLGTLPSMKQWKEKFKNDKNKKISKWHLTLSQTRFLLHEIGLGIVRANLHVDTWIDPIDIKQAVEFSLKHEQKCALGVEPQCVLSALYDKRMELLGKKPEYVKCKSDRKVKSVEECIKVIKDKLPMFSSDSTAEEKNKEMIAWMNGFFAFPSKYENDCN